MSIGWWAFGFLLLFGAGLIYAACSERKGEDK